MLNRAVMHQCHDVASSIDYISKAKRTVAWLHPVGSPDDGAIVEVTSSGDVDSSKYLPAQYKEIFRQHRVPLDIVRDGMSVFRISDIGTKPNTATCRPYLAVNEALFKQYSRDHADFKGTYNSGYTSDTGCLSYLCFLPDLFRY